MTGEVKLRVNKVGDQHHLVPLIPSYFHDGDETRLIHISVSMAKLPLVRDAAFCDLSICSLCELSICLFSLFVLRLLPKHLLLLIPFFLLLLRLLVQINVF